MTQRAKITIFLGATLLASPSQGQDCEPSQIVVAVPAWLGAYQQDQDLACFANVPSERTREALGDLLNPFDRSYYFSSYVAREAGYMTFLRAVEEARVDEQVGASPTAEGSTSLVSKGAIPQVLGFAVEHGGLNQSTNGTTATFQGNLLGVSRLLLGSQQFRYCPTADPSCDRSASEVLRNVAFSFSFDPSRESSMMDGMVMNSSGMTETVPVFTGSTRQLSQWGIRYAFSRRRQRVDAEYLSAWKESITPESLGAQAATWDENLQAFYDQVIQAKPDRYSAWLGESIEALLSAEVDSPNKFYEVFQARIDLAEEMFRELNPDFDSQLEPLLDAMGRYFGTRDQLVNKALSAATFTVEYTNRRPLNQPSQSHLRLIFTKKPSVAKATVSANFGLTFYNEIAEASTAGRFRDLQLSAQFERPLGEIPGFGDATFTVAGYYQWMKEDALITFGSSMTVPGTGISVPGETATLLGTKGHIGIGQAKLTIPLGGGGVKMPIAFTVANRTELINATEVRGNIGITFDLDSLFMRGPK